MIHRTKHFTAYLFLWAMLLVACAPADNTPPTQTARVAMAQARATEMAHLLQGTELAQRRQLTATAEALQTRLAAAAGWPVAFQDTYEDNRNDWAEGEDKGDLADVAWAMENGKFRWEAAAHQGVVWWNYPTSSQVEDFYLSIDTRLIEAAATAYLGVIFRMDDETNYYAFFVNNGGEMSLDQHSADGWETLISWTSCPALRLNQVNRIEVLGEGDHFSFWINGDLATQYQHDAYTLGYAGVAIGLEETGDSGVFEFDNFELRAPVLPPTRTPAP